MKSDNKTDVIRALLIGKWGEIARNKQNSSQLELIERAISVLDRNDESIAAYVIEKAWGCMLIDVHEAIAALVAME